MRYWIELPVEGAPVRTVCLSFDSFQVSAPEVVVASDDDGVAWLRDHGIVVHESDS